jgi:hypothetical protein
MKEGSNAPENAAFGYRMQKLSRVKVFVGRCSKIVSVTHVHTDFGVVQRVLMVVLGKV